MDNSLGTKTSTKSILKFAFPTIIMMVFMSLYTMMDGVFVSRLIDTDALSAVNIIYPLSNVVIAIGIMLATGGSAIVAKNMGEGKGELAVNNFSTILVFGIIVGIVTSILFFMFSEQIILFLGASPSLLDYCNEYALVLMLFNPLCIIKALFEFFLVTAGKPKLGLTITVVAGVSNMVLNYVFIEIINLGIAGAALGTGIGYTVASIAGLYFFITNRKGTLYLVKPKFNLKVIVESCFNGSSEMISNISIAITTLLFNIILMFMLGEDGVAAVTIILYSDFLFVAIFLGFSSGVAPIISYNYGANNKSQLRKIMSFCFKFIFMSSISMLAIGLLSSSFLVNLFTSGNQSVYDIALNGMYLFIPSFLFKGFNIFITSMFTAFSNGKLSAFLSFVRTFGLLIIFMLILPQLLDVDGVWLALPLAEGVALIITLIVYYRNKGCYY